MKPGHDSAVLFLLKSGRVRLYTVKPDGRELTLALLGDGNAFGTIDALSLGRDDVYAIVVEDALVCAMHRADAERLFRQHPQVGLRVIETLNKRVRDLQAMVERIAYEDVPHRIIRLLLHLAEDFGVSGADGFIGVDVPLTHEEVASMVGSTRETVTATLSNLAGRGIVRTGRRQLAIHPERGAACLETQ